MKIRNFCLSILAPLAILLPCSAHAAGWSVQKNETDPFDKSKSTFIAGTFGDSGLLYIRCLEGNVSLLIGSGPSNASAGDTVDLKIVADSKDVQEEEAEVLNSTNAATAVQFGDASTLDYLEGAQKISVRYALSGAVATVSFAGGRSLNDVITKARKACGIQPAERFKSCAAKRGGNGSPTDRGWNSKIMRGSV